MRKIQMMGINHSRATVAERELFSLTKAKQKELMEAVIRQQGVGGCVLLSTCNRTELYVSLQKEEDIDLAWVPGAFEIPLIASKMAKSGKYDAVICLGAVIRGATSHYDYVCAEVSKGIANVSLNTDIPVMFGVLTTDTIEQAIERAGTKAGNKGFECAEGAIEMVNLSRELEK